MCTAAFSTNLNVVSFDISLCLLIEGIKCSLCQKFRIARIPKRKRAEAAAVLKKEHV